MSNNTDVQKVTGDKRFLTGIEFQKRLLNLTRTIQDRLIQALPSNYPKDRNTNLAEFYRAVGREFALMQVSASDINEDKYHTDTRVEYLFQILGDTLFLGEKAVDEMLADSEYRAYLIRIRNAYYGGSRPANMEQAVSDLIGLPVTLKELYLDLRKKQTSYKVTDTHRMFFDIAMDGVSPASDVGTLLDNLKFFIDALKPAHVLYDNRLVWTEQLRSGPCRPDYVLDPSPETVYSADRIDMVTWLSSDIYKLIGATGMQGGYTGTISDINYVAQNMSLNDGRILVWDGTTELYQRTGISYTGIGPEEFTVGNELWYHANKDTVGRSAVIQPDWGYTGIIGSVDESQQRVLLTDGSTIVYNLDTQIYTRDGAGEYRIGPEDLIADKEIVFRGQGYTGQFRFYRTPTEVSQDWYRQFDPAVQARASFDEYVVKNQDIPPGVTAGWDVQVIGGIATLVNVDSKFYRRSGQVDYREKKEERYSLFTEQMGQLTYTAQFTVDDPTRTLTDAEAKDVFIYSYGYTGLLDSSVVYRIDTARTGALVEDGDRSIIEAIGENTEPCDRKAECQLDPQYEDLRKYWAWPDVQLTSGYFNVSYPFTGVNPPPGAHDLPGWYYLSLDPNSYVVPTLPMLDSQGAPATPQTIVVYADGLRVDGAVDSVDPWTGEVTLGFIPPFDTNIRIDYYWSARYPSYTCQVFDVRSPGAPPAPGDLSGSYAVITIGGTVRRLYWPFVPTDPALYGDDRDWQMNKFPILDQFGNLATPSDVTVAVGTYGLSGINYTVVPDAVEDIRPLLGHVRLNFIPPTGVALRFCYYNTHQPMEYLMLPDVGLTGYQSTDRLPDTFPGPRSEYGMLPDQAGDLASEPYWGWTGLQKIGYRYRMYNLASSAVLNSETLLLNDSERYGGSGSFKTRPGRLNRYDLLFSGEYLTDTDNNIVLNDPYLKKPLPPITVLNPGTPPFVKTFTDDTHHRIAVVADEHDTFDPDLDGGMDLRAGFSIINSDDSGIIDYNSVCSYEANRRITLHSDLKMQQFTQGDFDAPLSTIDDTSDSVPFGTSMVEEYYPNREMRVTDYLDYINQIPDDVRFGRVRVLKGSAVIKSLEGDFLAIRVGDRITLKDVPAPYTGMQDTDFTIVKIYDRETAEVNARYPSVSGEYAYEIIGGKVITADVMLAGGDTGAPEAYGVLNRILALNNSIGYDYGLGAAYCAHFSGVQITFPDPDPDPYPRSPDNPWIPNPPAMYYQIEPVMLDGATGMTNRTLGVTGVVLTSQVIDERGMYGVTAAGVTGPVGALDLGITGPVGYANPLTVKPYDVYFVPGLVTGIYSSCSEAEYRVRWRNWDQEIFLVSLGATGILIEPPMGLMDDVARGLPRHYWEVSTASLKTVYYHGTVLETSERISALVTPGAWPAGLIPLSWEDADRVRTAANPVVDLPDLRLGDSAYSLRQRILREILEDDSVRVSEIQEFKAI